MNESNALRARLNRWGHTIKDVGYKGWLIADFRWNNPLFGRLTGLSKGILSRRCFLWLPADGSGEACVIASQVDGHSVSSLDCSVYLYSGYKEMVSLLQSHLPTSGTIAMEYVEFGTLPTVSLVDGGLLELIRSLGLTVVSSLSLIAALEVWDERQRVLHQQAAEGVDEARRLALVWVEERLLRGESITEGAVAAVISSYFADHGLAFSDGPDVAVNANAADPHYGTTGGAGASIDLNSVLLIDLWTQVRDALDAPYADSTWMAYTGATPPVDVLQAFEAVRAARDAALKAIATSVRDGVAITGRGVDRAARTVLVDAGFGESIFHRTGHSLGMDHVHGMGTNLDDVEFPDDRELLAYSGFTVEPGLYWPGRFGMRLEVSAILLPSAPLVTTEIQRELTILCR